MKLTTGEKVIEGNKLTVTIPKEQREYLDLIIHQDAANNLSQAVSWCIDNCLRIEQIYSGVDACFIAYNDIRLDENKPEDWLQKEKTFENAMAIVVWNNAQMMSQDQFTEWYSKQK